MLKLSIIVVCLNAGPKLIDTLKSIQEQTFENYEVVIKDGGSKDDTIENAKLWLDEQEKFSSKVNFFYQKDTGIYDAMNQATTYASGEYLYFLNCGDSLYEEDSLTKFIACMKTKNSLIYYGNVYDRIRKAKVQSNPKIDDFACYRHVPNHQTCIYHKSLFANRGYNLSYKVRADYEHFLYSYFIQKANPKYIDVLIANYEGGGFSETKDNIRRSKLEHKEIISLYMSKSQIKKYQFIMMISLAPLRTFLAENKCFGALYQKLKKCIYSFRNKK